MQDMTMQFGIQEKNELYGKKGKKYKRNQIKDKISTVFFFTKSLNLFFHPDSHLPNKP